MKVKADPEASKYVYLRDLKTQELQRVEKDQSESFTGQAFYASEEEALLKAPYVIKDDSPFDRLQKSSSVDQQIEAIKEGIRKKEAELAEIKAVFIKEPRLKLLFSAEETIQFRQQIANLAYERDEEVNEEELSPHMQRQIKLTENLMQGLEEAEGEDKLEADLKILQEQMKLFDKKAGKQISKSARKKLTKEAMEVLSDVIQRYPTEKGFCRRRHSNRSWRGALN